MNLPYEELIRTHWSRLQARERALISFASALLAIAILYGAIWSPLQSSIQRLRTAAPAAQTQLAKMRAQAPMVTQLKGSAAAAKSVASLQTLVEQTTMANGIKEKLTRLESRAANTAELGFDAVEFNVLITWLAGLQAKHPVQVESAVIDGQGAPGLVNARLTLRLAGA